MNKLFVLIIMFFLSINIVFAQSAYLTEWKGDSEETATEEPPPIEEEAPLPEPQVEPEFEVEPEVEIIDEGELLTPPLEGVSDYSMWSDPLYFQYEQMMPALSSSLGRLNNRIATLAVTEFTFSPELDKSFQKVATAKLFGQLLQENPRLKLIKCNECNMVRSELKNGILTVSRGLSSKEARTKIAEKLNIQGFMTTRIILDDRQLSIVLNVYDAKEGRIILSDVVTGIPSPKRKYHNIYVGQLTLPVKDTSGDSLNHTAILLGYEQIIRFSESWLLTANFGLYADNNSKLAAGNQTFTSGMMFDGTIGWEFLSFNNNNVTFTWVLGIGEFLSTQFNFSVYGKTGLKTTIGQLFNINIYSLSFTETNLETPDETTGLAASLPGSGTVVTFGFQF